MKLRKQMPEAPPELTNAAAELLGTETKNRRYAFTFVDTIGVIERHRFAEVAKEAAQWADLLRRAGLQPGGRVVVLVGRDRHWRSALLGVVEAGGVAVPCSASSPVAEIASLAAESHAAAVISGQPRADLLEAGLAALCTQDLDPQYRARTIMPAPTTPHDFALILYEQNGSGLHGAAYTHDALLAQATWGAERLGLREGSRLWCTAPEGSVPSLWLLLAGWRLGVELVVVEGVLPPRVALELLDKIEPTAVWFSDEEYAALAAADAPAWVDLSSVGCAFSSGEEAEGALAFQKAFGVTPAAAPVSMEAMVVAAGLAQAPRPRPVRPPAEEIALRRAALAAAEARRRAEQSAARDAMKRAADERRRQGMETRRRDQREAIEHVKEDTRRQKAARDAARAEERHTAEAEEERQRAERAAAESREELRRAEEAKRHEEERLRQEKEERRRERRRAEEQQKEDARRRKKEATLSKLAEQTERVEEQRRTDEAKRLEDERLRHEKETRRREAQQAKEHELEEQHRQREARTRELAEQAARAEEERRAEEAKRLEDERLRREAQLAKERQQEEQRREREDAKNRKRAEQAARAEEQRRTHEAKRLEEERRRETQQAKELEREEERRQREEAKNRERAEQAARAEEERRAKEERQREEKRQREEQKAREREELEAKERQRREERRRSKEAKNRERAAHAAAQQRHRAERAVAARRRAALGEPSRRALLKRALGPAGAEHAEHEELTPEVVSLISHYGAPANGQPDPDKSHEPEPVPSRDERRDAL